MSRLTRPMALAILLFAGGCATLRPAPPADLDASLRLDLGLAALQAGQHADAFEELAWVMSQCNGREAGLHARYALVALELDPRNPGGRPDVAMQIMGDLILETGTPDWLLPLAETTYLLARGLGAPAAVEPTDEQTAPGAEEPAADSPGEPAMAEPPQPHAAVTAERSLRARGCGPAVPPSPRPGASLPALPGPSMARMLAEAEAERDTATTQALELGAELEALRRELEATRAELDRIRRTLRP